MRLPALGHGSGPAWIALAAGADACDHSLSRQTAAAPAIAINMGFAQHGGTHSAESMKVSGAGCQDRSEHAFVRENHWANARQLDDHPLLGFGLPSEIISVVDL